MAISKMSTAWYSRPLSLALWLAALVMMTAPGEAAAQSYGGGGGSGFGKLGGDLLKLICSFTQSPLVTVIAAVGLVVCFIVAGLNEDKGTVSKILKVIGFCLGIVMLPGIMSQIGFNWTC